MAAEGRRCFTKVSMPHDAFFLLFGIAPNVAAGLEAKQVTTTKDMPWQLYISHRRTDHFCKKPSEAIGKTDVPGVAGG